MIFESSATPMGHSTLQNQQNIEKNLWKNVFLNISLKLISFMYAY